MLNLVTPNLFDRSTDFISHKQILLFCNNEEHVDPLFYRIIKMPSVTVISLKLSLQI